MCLHAHEEFAERRRKQRIDGVDIEGWFTEDFTLAELKTLRARERIPLLRPKNAQHDGQLEIPTFDEDSRAACRGECFATHGWSSARGCVSRDQASHAFRIDRSGAGAATCWHALAKGLGDAPVFIQSFEVENLRWLRKAQLRLSAGAADGGRRCGPLRLRAADCTPEGLQRVARIRQRDWCSEEHGDGRIRPLDALTATSLVRDAHAAGLAVHVWTFRAENQFLPRALRRGDDPAAHGDMAAEVWAFVRAGVDGLFCDQPDVAVGALVAAGV